MRLQDDVRAAFTRERWRQNLSVVEVCRRLAEVGHPIPRWSYYKLERGERRIDLDDFEAICAALRLDPASMVRPVGKMVPTDLPLDLSTQASDR